MNWYLKCIKQHYFDFNGRARRQEYWMFALVNVIIGLVLQVVLGLISPKLVIIGFVYSLAVLLPALGVSVRRLHDQGKSGWMLLLAFVPLANIYLLFLFCQDSQPGENAYGPNPKA